MCKLLIHTATEKPEFRLVGGATPNEGRVEMLYKGEYGTICDDIWNTNTASVVCRSLGYTTALEATCCASFGEGSGPIFLDDVECTGQEDHLLECYHLPLNRSNCGHYEDASVVCKLPGETILIVCTKVCCLFVCLFFYSACPVQIS